MKFIDIYVNNDKISVYFAKWEQCENLKQCLLPQLNTLSALISTFFIPPPFTRPVHFFDICTHLPPFII